jgi:hypothetical protein
MALTSSRRVCRAGRPPGSPVDQRRQQGPLGVRQVGRVGPTRAFACFTVVRIVPEGNPALHRSVRVASPPVGEWQGRWSPPLCGLAHGSEPRFVSACFRRSSWQGIPETPGNSHDQLPVGRCSLRQGRKRQLTSVSAGQKGCLAPAVGLEPTTISLTARPARALCRPASSQLARHRRESREMVSSRTEALTHGISARGLTSGVNART